MNVTGWFVLNRTHGLVDVAGYPNGNGRVWWVRIGDMRAAVGWRWREDAERVCRHKGDCVISADELIALVAAARARLALKGAS